MNTLKKNQKSIAYHYDVSNDFYRLFLDKEMVYSCAYFVQEDHGLDHAQLSKLEHICKKLRLKPNDRLLDIGCGWGGLIIYASKNYGVKSLGITLSKNQYELARQRIKQAKLESLCRVELKDYRKLKGTGTFDKIVSVGMFEHVGMANLPRYFKIIHNLLTENGLFLNHGITHEIQAKQDNQGSKFITTYVFPDGELTNVSRVQHYMEEAGFEILDVESLRPHYAKTLEHWTRNLISKSDQAKKMVNEKIYRIWILYMAACAWGFQKGNISVYQVLSSKHLTSGFPPIPLTRKDLYR